MPRQERNRRKKKMEEREPSLRIGKVLTLLVPLAVVVVIVMNVQNWAKFIGDHYSFVLGGLGIFAAGMVAAKLLLEPSADGPGGRFAQILALADKWKHDSLQRENRELKEENRRLTKAAGKQKKADERAERAAAANAKAAKRVPELESRVRELTEKTGKLESELAETKTALAGAQSERDRNHEQVSALQTRLGELGNELGDARREAEAAGRELESLEERLQDSVPRNEHERLIEAARSEQPQDQADAGELAELTRRLEQAEAARATAEGRISTLESERDAQERRAEVAQSDREANIRLFGTWFDGVVALFPGDLELAEVPEAGVLNVRLAWVTQSLRALVEARGDAVQTGLDAQEQLATLEAATSRAEFLEEEAAELQAKVQAASAEGDLGIRALAPLASALRAALESPETPAELLELIEEEGVESALVMLEGSAALVSNYLGRLVELSGEDEELLEPLGEVLAFIVDAVQFTYRIDWLRELSPDCQQLLCEQCSEGFRLVLLLLAVAGTKQFEFLFDVEFEAIHDSLKPSVLAGLVLYAEERRRDARGIGNRELAELWLRRRRKLCFASAALRSGSAHLEAEHLRLLPKTSLPQDDPHGWLLMSTLARSGEFTPCRRALDYMLLLPTALMREILLDAINLTEGEEARDRKISKAELSMLGYDPFYVLAFLEFSKENMRVLGLDVYQLQMLTRLSATSHLQGNSGERVAHNLEPVRFLVLSGLSALGGKSGLARTLIQRLGRESARLSSSLERQLGAYEVTLKRFG